MTLSANGLISAILLLAIITPMFTFALFGPAPGGTGRLHGIILLVIGAVGVFSLASQIEQMKAATQSRFRLFFVVGLDVAFLVAGVLTNAPGGLCVETNRLNWHG